MGHRFHRSTVECFDILGYNTVLSALAASDNWVGHSIGFLHVDFENASANHPSFIHFHATIGYGNETIKHQRQVVALQLLRELLHSGVRMDTASCCTAIGALLRTPNCMLQKNFWRSEVKKMEKSNDHRHQLRCIPKMIA